MVTFCATAVGAILSSTVTVAVAVEALPLSSVTVSVTVLAPRLEQVNAVLLRLNDAIVQLSVEPLFTAAAVVEALPVASKYIVTFCATAVGAILSSTVTVAVAVEALPLSSVTVSVTVLAPRFEQVNAVLLKLNEAIVQLSVEPLFTAAAVVEALPVASKYIVTFC